ncbi:bifunctional folylpolyglutamate synthase/dihydrofolate synthase [Segnochrobactrum spirostomi]|uniref:tetrahydrofolate synthase n=1 Tax=Segnochrobactrum spirostomi TaxID=2608987 RepID=A0A6A7Y5G7_9HYPH|nr:folylpolyglutamate synthase/dihydrofolate synthase family protein [Segnochrobactrum spirostomi]MQT12899.1 bifunctional folylpolyglutamate synthase/dihydrofolate synthase [Segnochrobactrum spirostomi]
MDHASAILERLIKLHPKEIDLSLDRIDRLDAALGHPERRLPPVIHVAGTNGKGSVTATMRAILEAAGRSVHVYTSPHLVRFHERIRLGRTDGPGRFVDDATLVDALNRAEAANDGHPITLFEITTAAAFLLFAEHPADVLLLEVGLGGRLDATNVVEKPLASVITSISLDHEKFLGASLKEIAGEKAGIIKHGVPVIASPQDDVAVQVIERAVARVGAPLHLGGQDWTVSEERRRLVYQDEDGLLDLPPPRLIGRHQYENAGTAIAALRFAGLWPGSPAAEAGIGAVDWPARMQRLTTGKLIAEAPAGSEIWLDGGHNPGAGSAISNVMADLEDRVSRPLFLITGMLTTKDPAGFFRPFAGLARHVFTVPIFGSDSGRDPAELAELARRAGLSAEPVGGVRTALRLLAENWRFEPPPRILICGSLYLAGDVLSQNGTPPA